MTASATRTAIHSFLFFESYASTHRIDVAAIDAMATVNQNTKLPELSILFTPFFLKDKTQFIITSFLVLLNLITVISNSTVDIEK